MLMFIGCDKYDDTAITGRMDDLENRVTQLETLAKQLSSNVSALQLAVDALKNQDRIVSVEPLPENKGFVVEFETAGKITVYNGVDGKDGSDGTDGKTPVIGVQKDESDGQYYWTLDGTPILDNGKKIPATAQLGTPQIKLESDKFWFSVDGGKNWIECGDVRSAGIGTITDVKDNGDEVVFTLWDNSTITIPKVQTFALVIDRTDIGVLAGQTVFVNYTIVAGDNDTKVKAIADEGYKVSVNGNSKGGELAITAPEVITKGSVFLVAINGKGEVAGKILEFEKGDLVLVKDGVSIDANGGEIDLPFKTNMEAMVMIDPSANWIEQVPQTKALQEYTYKFNVKPYVNGTAPREGKIYINYDGGRKEFTVRQSNAVETGGGEADFNTFKTEVPATSSLRLLINDETDAGWKMTNGSLRGHRQFTPIPEGGKAPCINGGTNAVGVLESPMLTGGCDKLTIAYGVQSAGNIKTCGLKFLVEVTPEEGEPFSEIVYSEGSSIVNKTAIQAILDVKISGSFSIKITNLCPKNTESVNNRGTYDSVIIQTVSWTGYSK